SPETETLPDHINPRFYAVNIAQSLPYMLHPDMGGLGPNLALFPLGMTFAFFAGQLGPPSAPDMSAMELSDSPIDGLDGVNGSRADDLARHVVYWFGRIFNDLDSRHMPGKAFISRLLKAVGLESPFKGVHPLIANAASTSD
ncbi:MAG: hypothetical protein Q9164_007490, partial [Protoblastenia rupestris]